MMLVTLNPFQLESTYLCHFHWAVSLFIDTGYDAYHHLLYYMRFFMHKCVWIWCLCTIGDGFAVKYSYWQISNIGPTSIGNKIIDRSDVVGASPASAALTTSSYST